MRKLLPLLSLLLCGCTVTEITTPTGLALKRRSFLQKVEIPSLEIATNGTARLEGYKTDGGQDALKAH